jgi:hypothetical protein
MFSSHNSTLQDPAALSCIGVIFYRQHTSDIANFCYHLLMRHKATTIAVIELIS